MIRSSAEPFMHCFVRIKQTLRRTDWTAPTPEVSRDTYMKYFSQLYIYRERERKLLLDDFQLIKNLAALEPLTI